MTLVLNLLSALLRISSPAANDWRASCALHRMGKYSIFSRISCITSIICIIGVWEQEKKQQACKDMTCTSISSILIISTEQWLRATKSRFTPNEPDHLESPVMQLSPTESLHDSRGDIVATSSHRWHSQHFCVRQCVVWSVLLTTNGILQTNTEAPWARYYTIQNFYQHFEFTWVMFETQ